jgi:hypothetical protein
MAKPKEPQKWNGAERLAAIFPALGAQVPVRNRSILAERLSDAELNNMNMAAAAALSSAANQAGVTSDQISDWIDRFAALGKPGLLADDTVDQADCADQVQGTWELVSRLSGGQLVNARSNIYFDMDPKNATGWQLTTMWTEENHFENPAANSSFVLAALVQLTFQQAGPYTVIGRSKGRIIGNFGEFLTGKDVTDTFQLVRTGNNERMVPLSSKFASPDPNDNFYSQMLVGVGGDPNTIVYQMSGMPATAAHPRTVDVVDTYVNVNHERPLIGGWEPIQDYFNRMSDPQLMLRSIENAGKNGAALHFFQKPIDRARLAAYTPLDELLRSMGERA